MKKQITIKARGKWGDATSEEYYCEECGYMLFWILSDESDWEEWQFCPHCGKPIDFNNIIEEIIEAFQ